MFFEGIVNSYENAGIVLDCAQPIEYKYVWMRV